MIFWPIRPPKLFCTRHIHTIIINRSQSIEHILQKNFIIMRVSVKFFPNFIAIITRLELYCQNSGQLKFKPFIRKNMYHLQNMRRKIIFSGFGRARATELSLRNFLQRTCWSPISRTILSSRFCAISTGKIESFRKKSTNEDRCILVLWNCTKNSIFPIFSPFWKFWKISTRWNKYILIEEYVLLNNFFEKFAKI